MAASAISPTAITFYRLVLALAIMGLFTAVPAWRNRKIILRHWPKLALYGALSSALFRRCPPPKPPPPPTWRS